MDDAGDLFVLENAELSNDHPLDTLGIFFNLEPEEYLGLIEDFEPTYMVLGDMLPGPTFNEDDPEETQTPTNFN